MRISNIKSFRKEKGKKGKQRDGMINRGKTN